MDEREEVFQRKLEDLDREKRQIISLVSHDIKAPLNRMFALVQLMRLEDDNLTADQVNYLDKMHLVVADGLGLIRNLVDYRNLEYKKVELFIEKVNLTQVIQLAMRNFQSLAAKKKITVEVDVPKELILQSDHHALIRIFENLVSNAIKFSAEGKKVMVRAGETASSVFFSIQDEARGFKENDEKNLYRKFQKLSALPTAGESATGLGLFITKELADKINGEVTYVTEEGRGSTFTVTLPKKIS